MHPYEQIIMALTLSEFITELQAKGYNAFTAKQAEGKLNISSIALRAAIRRLKKKGVLAEPVRGFYLIVAPEYRILGCLPADHFIDELMKYWGISYYVGLLSAAQYHGAAHQKSQQFQIMISEKHRPITCGQTKIIFITKAETEQMPTQDFKTPQGIIKVSTPEVTAMDLVIYPNRAAGLDNVLTILIELAEMIDPKRLLSLIQLSKEITWVQRLGYLFDQAGAEKQSEILYRFIKNTKQRIQKRILLPGDPVKNAILDNKWKLLVNVILEPDI